MAVRDRLRSLWALISVIPGPRMGFIRLILVATVAAAVSVAVSGCAAEDPAASAAGGASGRGGGRGGTGGTVPVTVAPVVHKTMPIEISVIGTAEAFSNVG